MENVSINQDESSAVQQLSQTSIASPGNGSSGMTISDRTDDTVNTNAAIVLSPPTSLPSEDVLPGIEIRDPTNDSDNTNSIIDQPPIASSSYVTVSSGEEAINDTAYNSDETNTALQLSPTTSSSFVDVVSGESVKDTTNVSVETSRVLQHLPELTSSTEDVLPDTVIKDTTSGIDGSGNVLRLPSVCKCMSTPEHELSDNLIEDTFSNSANRNTVLQLSPEIIYSPVDALSLSVDDPRTGMMLLEDATHGNDKMSIFLQLSQALISSPVYNLTDTTVEDIAYTRAETNTFQQSSSVLASSSIGISSKTEIKDRANDLQLSMLSTPVDINPGILVYAKVVLQPSMISSPVDDLSRLAIKGTHNDEADANIDPKLSQATPSLDNVFPGISIEKSQDRAEINAVLQVTPNIVVSHVHAPSEISVNDDEIPAILQVSPIIISSVDVGLSDLPVEDEKNVNETNILLQLSQTWISSPVDNIPHTAVEDLTSTRDEANLFLQSSSELTSSSSNALADIATGETVNDIHETNAVQQFLMSSSRVDDLSDITTNDANSEKDDTNFVLKLTPTLLPPSDSVLPEISMESTDQDIAETNVVLQVPPPSIPASINLLSGVSTEDTTDDNSKLNAIQQLSPKRISSRVNNLANTSMVNINNDWEETNTALQLSPSTISLPGDIFSGMPMDDASNDWDRTGGMLQLLASRSSLPVYDLANTAIEITTNDKHSSSITLQRYPVVEGKVNNRHKASAVLQVSPEIISFPVNKCASIAMEKTTKWKDVPSRKSMDDTLIDRDENIANLELSAAVLPLPVYNLASTAMENTNERNIFPEITMDDTVRDRDEKIAILELSPPMVALPVNTLASIALENTANARDTCTSVLQPYPEISSPHVTGLHRIRKEDILIDRDEEDTGLLLGQGTFGAVFRGRLRSAPDRPVVIKVYNSAVPEEDVVAEATIQLYLEDIAAVPRMFGVLLPDVGHSNKALIQEYCGRGQTLAAALVSGCYTEDHWICVCRLLTTGLWAIHRKDVLHNDIKSDNVLLEGTGDDDLFVYFIDFGLASYRSSKVFTVDEDEDELYAFMAPEVKAGQATSFASDVYSLGFIIREIAQAGAPCLTKYAVQCMQITPRNRPSTARLLSRLSRLDGRHY